jgi:hypothetical protein
MNYCERLRKLWVDTGCGSVWQGMRGGRWLADNFWTATRMQESERKMIAMLKEFLQE